MFKIFSILFRVFKSNNKAFHKNFNFTQQIFRYIYYFGITISNIMVRMVGNINSDSPSENWFSPVQIKRLY